MIKSGIKTLWARLDFTASKNLMIYYLTNGKLIDLGGRSNAGSD